MLERSPALLLVALSLSKYARAVNCVSGGLHWAWPGNHRAREASVGPRPARELMSAPAEKPLATHSEAAHDVIPEELAIDIRRLAHDLSNALEIVVQTSYLLSTADLKEPAATWLGMLDSGVNKGLEINLQLRNYIKAHTAK